MPKGPHVGYVYAIKDPTIDKITYRYVGVSNQPWIAIRRLVERPPASLREWVASVREQFPDGLQIYGDIICSRYHGDILDLPPVTDGMTVLEWDILDYDEEDAGTVVRTSHAPFKIGQETKKTYWMNKLIDKGHPILNGKAGRPKQDKLNRRLGYASPGERHAIEESVRDSTSEFAYLDEASEFTEQQLRDLLLYFQRKVAENPGFFHDLPMISSENHRNLSEIPE